ncbi:hypothetical protein EBL_c24640 [Shimwellia blattae DSM 4481 = NBRC 105725]|uniref:cyclic-guanylate-specific phosphodiesterase n=2 Tax=Shimwellia blattae TaxID=563 RepID=I2BAJ6_SHIBC|nr:hypothetical protein EBL_c24640 [Shimwellia blattae DSM 4481 = NBRC 105725]GAB79872.1 hypothetical protein YcgG [Shimwellia blattae DSM 4481 = NBRC 105725]VDY65049.1 phage resistance protein [Shimwellia blattae]VEC23426.1 phage resistance protein [Shimwellia blattae]
MRRKTRIIIITASVIGVILSGAALTWLQVINTEINQTAATASRTVNNIDSLLDEARLAADKARPYLPAACTLDTIIALEKIAVSIRHIRLINTYLNEKLLCSSFGDKDAINVNYNPHTQQKLTIINDNKISPDEKVIVLQTPFPEGMVVSSFSAAWISESLKILNSQRPLTIQIGDKTLTQSGDIHINDNEKTAGYHVIKSQKYPFSVAFSSALSIPLSHYIQAGKASLLLTLILAIMTGLILRKHLFRNASIYEELKDAIASGEIVPWYQPVINNSTKELYGIEILARWVTPSGEVIPPDAFIPLAEQSGLIIPLTRKIMVQAGNELPSLWFSEKSPFHISFNVTTSHIQSPEFISECTRFINKFPKDTITLTAEIIEREPFDKDAELKEKITELRKNGIKISLDDFGTGFSNINYLETLAIDIIKIDKLFVNAVIDDGNPVKLIDYVIDMANDMNITIIVEGVENAYQVNYLADKVNFFQGFYFSKPLSFPELKTSFARFNRM